MRHASSCDNNKPPLMKIDDKVAMITGGTSGIGLCVANELLKENAKVVVISGIADKQGEEAAAKMNEKHGSGRCIYLRCDVMNDKEFKGVFNEVANKYGALDILMNNAGMLHDKAWEKTIELNVNAVVRGTMLGYELMPKINKGKGGVVVNTASIYGFDLYHYAPVYNMSKYAVLGLTRAFGSPIHAKKSGVRIIALCPGITNTVLVTNSGETPMLYDEWTKPAFDEVAALPLQPPKAPGRATAYMIKYAETGTCWPIEGGVLYRTDIPDRKSFSTKVMDVLK